MSTPPKTTAQMYEELTDEQVTARLAKDVMGWETRYEKDCYGYDYLQVLWPDSVPYYASGKGKGWVGTHGFNPMRDWNDWRVLEEKVMENGPWETFVTFLVPVCSVDTDWAMHSYASTDLQTRCRAVLAAWDSLNTR